MSYKYASILSALALSSLMSVSAQAITISTEATLYSNGDVSDSASTITPDFSSYNGLSTSASSASAYSSASGILNVGAYGYYAGGTAAARMPWVPGGNASAQAISTWENTITNNTASSVDYKYMFYIANPRIGTQGEVADYAGLSIEIFLNDSILWSAYAEISECTLEQSGFGSPVSSSGCTAQFASFTTSVSLGTLTAGSSFKLSYVMSAYINDGTDESGSYAIIGDPFNITGEEHQIIATQTPTGVAEPLSLALLGGGLAGLALLRRRKGDASSQIN